MDDHVMFGYGLTEIQTIARESVMLHLNWLPTGDIDELIEVAWEGVVTALCMATERPERNDLFYAGYKAAKDDVRQRDQMRGYPQAKITDDGLVCSRPKRNKDGDNFVPSFHAPQFERYWALHTHTPGPENAVVDRVAFQQIWRKMYWLNRQTLKVHAICDYDNERTAEMLMCSKRQVEGRLHRAREEFQKLWYQHETPPAKQTWRRSFPGRRPDARLAKLKAQVKHLRNEGMTYTQIREATGASLNFIASVVKKDAYLGKQEAMV